MMEEEIMQADRKQLTEISEIRVDCRKNLESRKNCYIEQTGNPYMVKSGDYIAAFEYGDCSKDIAGRMKEYLAQKIKIRYGMM